MIGADRVALVGWLWFVFWIVGGDLIGRWFGMPGTGMVVGFLVALFTRPDVALGDAGMPRQLDVRPPAP